MVSRRVQLGHRTREAFAEASGLSHRTLSYIEKADERTYSASTIAQLEHALKWLPGSVEAILAGGDPTPTDGLPELHPLAWRLHQVLTADLDPAYRAALEASVTAILDAAETYRAGRARGGRGRDTRAT